MSWSGYGWRCPCGGTVSESRPGPSVCPECGAELDTRTAAGWRMVRVDIDTEADPFHTWIHVHGLAETPVQRGHICPVCRVEILTSNGHRWATGGHHPDCPQLGSLPPWSESPHNGPLIESVCVKAGGGPLSLTDILEADTP